MKYKYFVLYRYVNEKESGFGNGHFYFDKKINDVKELEDRVKKLSINKTSSILVMYYNLTGETKWKRIKRLLRMS